MTTDALRKQVVEAMAQAMARQRGLVWELLHAAAPQEFLDEASAALDAALDVLGERQLECNTMGEGQRMSAPCGHEELIESIINWSKAYPLEAFPEPDHKATGHDPSLCSASMGRHVIKRLMELLSVDERGSE